MGRIVIKVGSHVLTENAQMSNERLFALISLIDKIKKSGDEVILVSSGAVAAGYTMLPIERDSVANRQTLAAVGQPLLLRLYQDACDSFSMISSQVLLSADVFETPEHINHAKVAIDTLLKNGVIPIVNENDTVSIDELVFGDNDRLSAHVAYYFDASLLVILSDIDAYYTKDPHKFYDAEVRPVVYEISKEELEAKHSANHTFATGGIVTKLQAADFLMKKGIDMYLASGFDLTNAESFLIDGKHISGTLFSSKQG